MKTEISVLEKLRDIMARELLGEGLSKQSFLIDFPDIDSMRTNSMFYIQPDESSIESLTTSSDLISMSVHVMIVCKGATYACLMHRVFSLSEQFGLMLRSNRTLDGYVDYLQITNREYFPSVTGGKTMTAIELALEVQWTKEYEEEI